MSLFTKNCLRIGGIVFVLGFVLIGISFACGFNWHGINTRKYDFDYSSEYDQDIQNIDIDISIADITIKRGDTFSIDAENMDKDSFESYIEDGTWKIKDDKQTSKIFGINIPFLDEDYKYKAAITIPENFDPEQLSIKLGAGRVRLCNLQTEEINFNIGAGELECGTLAVNHASKIKVGAGKVSVDYLVAKDIDLDCGAGEMEIMGDISGDSKLNCGVGHVELRLTQEESNYDYDVESGIGEVKINDEKYYFTNSNHHGNDAENTFDIKCGIGSIEVYNQ